MVGDTIMDSAIEAKIKIGAVIRKARKRKNYTQEQLAELLNVTAGFLGQIERDESYPSFENLVRLIYILDIDPQLLFFPDLSNTSKDFDIELLDNEIRLNISALNRRNKETILYLSKRLIELQATNASTKGASYEHCHM